MGDEELDIQNHDEDSSSAAAGELAKELMNQGFYHLASVSTTARSSFRPRRGKILHGDASLGQVCSSVKGMNFWPKARILVDSESWYMAPMQVECFEGIRQVLRPAGGGLYAEGFFESLRHFKQLGSGSGISGAAHFVTLDGRFYLKTIPAREVEILRYGTFLSDYAEHVKQYPSTLLAHILGLVRFKQYGYFQNRVVYVLIMDNLMRSIDFNRDHFLHFDMKGSQWKHRITKKGGLRCSPLFPLAFWKGSAAGEDIDFVALRTLVSDTWFANQDKELASAQEPRKQFLQDRLQEVPISDACLASHQWVSAHLGDSEDFCEILAEQFELYAKVYAPQAVFSIDACEHWLGRTSRSRSEQKSAKELQAEWAATLRQEKQAFESVRNFFGYSSAGRDLEQKPLVVEPFFRGQLTAQIQRDVDLLAKHNLMDYSMSLLIKHDSAADACHAVQADNLTGGNIFEQYRGGMRAVGLKGDEAEHAVYSMRIIDFLSYGGVKKTLSNILQSFFGSNDPAIEPEHYMEKVMRELVEQVPYECDNIAGDAGAQPYCWSRCSAEPTCETFAEYLGLAFDLEPEPSAWEELATYSFRWRPHNSSLGCAGEDGSRRLLCGRRGLLYDDLPLPPSVPDHIARMDAAEVWRDTANPFATEILSMLNMKLYPPAPTAARKIAIMALDNVYRQPLGEDTVAVQLFADRFKHFFSSWIVAPDAEDWARQVAACGH